MSVEIDNFKVDEVNNYDTVFPSLPSNGVAFSSNSVWNTQENKLAIKRHLNTTQTIHVPYGERKHKDPKSFGFDANKKCEEIAGKFGVKVEMCGSKDQSLHVVISGPEEKVAEAKRVIVAELQAERDHKIKVSKDQHKFLIGKNGSILNKLQEKTCTKIQIPRSDSNSDMVTITGPKEGIQLAIHEINLICEEQSKTGFERLPIPKVYHPWIRGFNNEIANDISNRTGAKINIPPPQIEKDEIAVSGDREKVDAAVAEINRIYAAKSQQNVTKLAIEITKSQHKLIIGKNGSVVQDIFKDHDVYVQVPKLESDSETIYLYGEEAKLGAALTQVIAKSNSVRTVKIDVPSWLHRHMIGEKGSNISKITADYPSTHVKFETDDKITVEGPPNEVEKVKETLENITIGLKKILLSEELAVDAKFYPQLVGSKKTENLVARLNKEHDVVVRLPPENSSSNIVRIEGSPENVVKAKRELQDLVARMENERSKDIIIEQKYHSSLIGKNGKNLNEVRAKFNDVQISIPSLQEKSDIITIRGNKNDVEKCFKHMQQLLKEMQESNYQEEMQIVKEFHRMIIGKHGAFIRKVRDDTHTRIDVPGENSDSNAIVMTGKRDNVQKARRLIEEKVRELINIKEDFVEIPHQFHSALIGKGGGIIKQIRQDCGGVIINIPPESPPCDKITLRGPIEELKKAKQELLKLAEQKNDLSYSEEIPAKSEYHRFLVGKNGSRANYYRETFNVRIIFPEAQSAEGGDLITIIGKKENVQKARVELEKEIKALEEEVTQEISVDAKWHKFFFAKRGELKKKISDENCNVRINFPQDKLSSQVTVKGPRDAVASAIKQIQEFVNEMENQVTIEVSIERKHHPAVIGAKGMNTNRISSDFKVNIQFPARPAENSEEHDPRQDVFTISGLKENCENAKQALLDLIPMEENFTFPAKFHKELLADKAEVLRKLINDYNVQINVPKREENADFVVLLGVRENLEQVKVALSEKLADLELKNYTVEITNVKGEIIPQLRGRSGAECEKLQKKFQVKIYFGQKGENDKIKIIGVQKNVEDCEKFIRQKIEDEESKQSQEIEIDQRVHSRIIGSQGKALARLTDKFKVEIKFQRNTDIVIVKGKDMDQIEDACDHLKNLEEEYLQDLTERQQYIHPSNRSENFNGSVENSQGFVVKGAPWEQVPDTNNMEDFPTISTSVTNGQNGQKSMWGLKK
ncbi:vigilin-like isoform X1 [Brachionus plicatilis]|uniref:Vigilin-like isoform X1 n=1 Tax=Brachionus plicatilis TaxID=10195 RepID=A0A3M7S7Q8_BRAPC|nr:vigilin-like isoform X1 [Brachionus plicatilis]